MGNNDYEHLFGFATEAFMLDWAVAQFYEYANTVVTDKREIVVNEYRDVEGCCDLCYTEDVRMTFEYGGATLWYKGIVTIAGGSRDFAPDYDPFDVDTPH